MDLRHEQQLVALPEDWRQLSLQDVSFRRHHPRAVKFCRRVASQLVRKKEKKTRYRIWYYVGVHILGKCGPRNLRTFYLRIHVKIPKNRYYWYFYRLFEIFDEIGTFGHIPGICFSICCTLQNVSNANYKDHMYMAHNQIFFITINLWPLLTAGV